MILSEFERNFIHISWLDFRGGDCSVLTAIFSLCTVYTILIIQYKAMKDNEELCTNHEITGKKEHTPKQNWKMTKSQTM